MRRALAALCFAAFAFSASAFAQPTTPEQWRAATAQDLDAIKAIISADTPIGAGAAGPTYDQWLTQGYAEAQARVPHVENRAGYFYALAAYVNGFHDSHLSLSLLQSLPAPRWPGFIVTRQGDAFQVSWRDSADAAVPDVGAEILSCDGQTLDALFERNVYAFVVNARLPEARRRAAPRLFLDVGNPFADMPHACVFRTGVATSTVTLNWRALPNPPGAFNLAFSDAGLGPAAVVGLDTSTPGVAWVGAPTFAAGAQSGTVLHQVEIHPEIRNGRAIVIDLRGNTGGSSDAAQELARTVFGAEYVSHMPLPNPGGAALWRASAGNLAYQQDIGDELERRRTSSTRANAWSREVLRGLSRALSRGEPTWRQGSDASVAGGGISQRRPQGGTSPVAARVYVLSNGSCASACLDFADIALRIPGVQLIGAPTSADGLLADVRSETLPSGEARFAFAQKMMLGRGRGAFEYYTPDVAYSGPWSDAAVRAWVMQLINTQAPSH